jgi:hypothetical protein
MGVDLEPGQISPLQYLLRRINNPRVSPHIRDRLAIAAAPFCHPRLVEKHQGKKAKAEKAAKMAGLGSVWGEDLQYEIRAPQ